MQYRSVLFSSIHVALIHQVKSFALLKRAASSATDSSLFLSTGPDDLPEFSSKEEYLKFLDERGSLPKGFRCGTASGTFIPVEAPAMGALPIKGTVIALDEPTDSWAAVFTKNKFPGSPIKVGRRRLSGGSPLQALVINNKVSNVCSGGDGEADSEMVCEAVANGLNLSGGALSVLPSSTGVIGWRLPAKELCDIVPKAIENLMDDTALDAATAIMTTDRYPKLRSYEVSNGGRVVGIAKGAGMIEPNMATMLSYIMTDVSISKSELQSMLDEIVGDSFNSISVDGDESTSDTVAVVSSNQLPLEDKNEFKEALAHVCQGLSTDIVRNGEGTSHVMKVKVTCFPGSNDDARRLAKQVVNSPLFKCAVSGNDPNTGRLAGAVGSFLGKLDDFEDSSTKKMTMTLGNRIIFKMGKFVLEGDEVEMELSNHMKDAGFGEHDEYPTHQKFVEIGINFGGVGKGKATVYGSDLTKEYVAVNADYRS